MGSARITDDVLNFIREHINSVEQLEVLLLLRSQPSRSWTAEQVSEELRTQPTSAATRLADLQARGLLATGPGQPSSFRYQPRTSELDNAVATLASLYPDHRHAIIELIFSKPIDRIKVFARAFRFLKEPGEDDTDG